MFNESHFAMQLFKAYILDEGVFIDIPVVMVESFVQVAYLNVVH